MDGGLYGQLAWLIIGFYLFLCLIPASIAQSKFRSGAGFFLLSVFTTPIIGLIAALIIGPDSGARQAEQLRSGKLRKCPDCAEAVLREAVKCKHCGAALQPIPPEPPTLLEKIFQGK